MINICRLILFLSISLVQAEQQIPTQTRLAMGFYYPSLSNVSNQTDIQLSLNYWLKELTDKIDIDNAYSVMYDDIDAMKTAFDNGKLDMIVAPPLLLAIHFNRALLANGFVAVKQKNKKDHLVIISSLKGKVTPGDYLGKHLLLPKNDLLAELFLKVETIINYHRPYQQVFREVTRVNSNQRMILDLFFGRADVAVVYESMLSLMTEMNPQIAEKIKVLDRFPIKSRNYGYFHRDYHDQVRLKKVADQFSSETRGKQILEAFQLSDIDTSFVDDLVRFDNFYRTYLMLKKTLVNE